MRLTRQKANPTRPQLNMAAMIDVVFLLLIFFLTTTAFQVPEKDLPSQLPLIGVGEDTRRPHDAEKIRIHLEATMTGSLLTCDGRSLSFGELDKHLAAMRTIADFPVIIDGDPTVPAGDMVRALDSCYQADLRRVAFAAN